MGNKNHGTIAYFSMEIGLVTDMPTYSGGLGVLAGDTIRAAADLKVPMVAVTLLHRKGYFYPALDSGGRQIEEPVDWAVDDFLDGVAAAGIGDHRGPRGRSARLEIRRRGPGRFFGAGLFSRQRSAGEFRVGPDADALSLRRRSPLPALPGSHPRHRRRAHVARPRSFTRSPATI